MPAANGTIDIIPPPRLSGVDPRSDAKALEDWIHRFYEAAIIQGGLVNTGAFSDELQNHFPSLYSLGSLTGAADKLAYFTAADTFGLTDLTATARTLISKSTTGDMLTFLGASAFNAEDVQDIVATMIQNTSTIAWTYNDGANQIEADLASLTGFTTTDLAEGSNLYYTAERVDDRVAALLQSAGGITWTYNDGAGTLTPALDKVTDSGTYTPTYTHVANVDATTAYSCQYLRVGDEVTVSGRVDIDPTTAAGTQVQIGVSLPIASNFANSNECGGTIAAASTLQAGSRRWVTPTSTH